MSMSYYLYALILISLIDSILFYSPSHKPITSFLIDFVTPVIFDTDILIEWANAPIISFPLLSHPSIRSDNGLCAHRLK